MTRFVWNHSRPTVSPWRAEARRDRKRGDCGMSSLSSEIDVVSSSVRYGSSSLFLFLLVVAGNVVVAERDVL